MNVCMNECAVCLAVMTRNSKTIATINLICFIQEYFRSIRRWEIGMPGINVGGYNINNIRYADDTVLIADNETELQEMLDTVVRESEKKAYL